MLTNCGCIANKEQTAILTPCQLHAAWAKTYAAQTWGDAKPGEVIGPGCARHRTWASAVCLAPECMRAKTPREEPR